MEDDLILEKEETVWTLTLNRPKKRNAVYPDLLSRLERVFINLEDDSKVRVIVLRGAGDKAFCGGYDMTFLNPLKEQKDRARQVVEAILGCSRPVIAMINGDCIGTGTFLAMACDIRVASSHARFGYPPAKRGFIPSYWAVSYYSDLLGLANCKEILLLGRYFDAKHARDMGMVHFVVPKEELGIFTNEIVRELVENAPLTIKAVKAIIFSRTVARWNKEKVPPEVDTILRSLSGKKSDQKEGLDAFFEKRKPRFTGE